MNFYEKYFGGHVNLGPITIYGENAMHWGVNIATLKWGYICFRLPFRCFKKWWPLYFYLSPNATPWASTYYRGDKLKRALAEERLEKYGHNFDTELLLEDTKSYKTSKLNLSKKTWKSINKASKTLKEEAADYPINKIDFKIEND